MALSRASKTVVCAIVALLVDGCSGGGSAMMTGDGLDLKKMAMGGVPSYKVSITNLTKGQIFSPPLFVTGSPDTHVWQEGQLASPAVEQVAETGVAGNLAEMMKDSTTDVVMVPEAVKPGETKTIIIHAHDGDVLSAIAMLVRTNDGFTGLDDAAIKPGTLDVMAYDAGTEENSEKRSDVPGPPFLGTHGTPTVPPQPIHIHPGIKGIGDLTAEMNWNGPVARIVIASQ